MDGSVEMVHQMIVKDMLIHEVSWWNEYWLHKLFDDAAVGNIMKIPLFNCVNDDLRVWWPEKNDIYFVRFAYKLTMNNMTDLSHLRVDRQWSLINLEVKSSSPSKAFHVES